MNGFKSMSDSVKKNPWEAMRRFTNARIALGRAGDSLPTTPLLAFNLAHAQARDAVHHALDLSSLGQQLMKSGFAIQQVHSAAANRQVYLQRPDLGRRLSTDSREVLIQQSTDQPDVVFVIADGLSSTAAQRHAMPLLNAICPILLDWKIGPVVVAQQSRVALGDEIGEILGAQFVVMLIGERPGLSSPDSLGIYLTHAPKVGCTDAQRNCISNVRPEGLSYAAAATKLHYLMTEARRLKLTGVELKDNSDAMLMAS